MGCQYASLVGRTSSVVSMYPASTTLTGVKTKKNSVYLTETITSMASTHIDQVSTQALHLPRNEAFEEHAPIGLHPHST